jgi:hypothetical protein
MTYKIKKKKKVFGLIAIMILSLINLISAQDINMTMKLVNVDDVDTGLLPDIYHGTLRFFSVTLSPMIILIFLIFFVLIILLIGALIKKVAKSI